MQFNPRNLAAHAAMMIVNVGDTTQLLRLYREGEESKTDEVTIERLRADVRHVRSAYAAIQAIGDALHRAQPRVLTDKRQSTTTRRFRSSDGVFEQFPQLAISEPELAL